MKDFDNAFYYGLKEGDCHDKLNARIVFDTEREIVCGLGRIVL